jgi:peptidoglycan/LPS O-acetylase OafA/YrhL
VETSTLVADGAAWSRADTPAAISGERLEALDSLRGVMALAVAIYHFGVLTQALEGAVRNASIVFGIYSVQGFFIISGFCFFRLYGRARFDRSQLMRFHVRRFARIAPLFYVAIALTYLIHEPVTPNAPWERWLENITLSFGFFHPNHALVIGGWSIGIEYMFYLVFPLLAWATRPRVVLYLLLVPALAWAAPYTFHRVAAASPSQQFNVYVQVGNHAALFLLGGVLADLHERVPHRLPLPLSAAAIAWLWWTALAMEPPIVDHIAVMVGLARLKYAALCGASVGLCAFTSSGAAPVAPLRWLGALSYSIYLVHPIAWHLSSRVLADRTSPSVQLLAAVGVTLALASCTRLAIEKPAIALGRRFRERARSSNGSDAPPPLAAK